MSLDSLNSVFRQPVQIEEVTFKSVLSCCFVCFIGREEGKRALKTGRLRFEF